MQNSQTYLVLNEFIQKRMRMSHIYQPVMLRELLYRKGTASVEQVAHALLAYDQSQIDYYSHITKNMVGAVLSSKNQVVEKSGCETQG